MSNLEWNYVDENRFPEVFEDVLVKELDSYFVAYWNGDIFKVSDSGRPLYESVKWAYLR
jgi:hypothetical protein